ncbi:T9SS type A sorting domain-containing protein [uncultured Algibacter sp.]|uniref:T9SS type A sorting domain-containing protein n=1 Tax=uncultured Algibacter sp. TaxID=298659 RepID=UPI0026396C68|nr:T9SS type A sorting domain-containing protein [uncultured Algibacter sp.]
MKKITLTKFFSLIITLLTVISFGYGQSIFTNPITGSNVGYISPYTADQVVDANITVTGISRGPDIAGNNATNRYNTRGWNSGSFNNNDYFEFTLIPNAGYEINFVNFEYTGQASGTGPSNFLFRSSIDGYTSNIGVPTESGTTIDLSDAAYQSITSSITFRIYAWGATSGLGTYSINDFTFNGIVNALGSCTSVSTWDGTSWDTVPTLTAVAVIDGNFNANLANSFSACSLQINAGNTLTVSNGGFIDIEYDITNNGTILVETEGNFVQNDDAGTFTNNGISRVTKQTASKADWFYYTYWSSPVADETIGSVFPDVDGDRRFSFNAANFVDTNGDDIDDNGDDWQAAGAGDTMIPGVGYAATEARLFLGGSGTATFEGTFNTGDINTTIAINPANTGINWNFIGNPYPSAIDFDAFYTANSSVVDGTAYFWSQATPHAESNPGSEQSNFSKNDYAMYASGSGGGTAGASGVTPTQYIPSGQGFFIAGLTPGTATFTNAMRMADNSSNNLFFKNSKSKKITNNANRIWINLTSDNGVFNQILLAYVDGATSGIDGLAYDAPRLLTEDYYTTLYSTIESSNKKYAIQGKSINNLDESEIVKLGFATNINDATLYKLSIAQFEGDFLSSNSVYLKDNLLNIVHNLTDSDYTFTSETGEFNDRFEIRFNATSLSTVDLESNTNTLKIVELNDDNVQFTASKNIETIRIYDLLGRQLYQFEGKNTSETYRLSSLSGSIYIAEVTLLNGVTITKKAFKK